MWAAMGRYQFVGWTVILFTRSDDQITPRGAANAKLDLNVVFHEDLCCVKA